MRKPSSQPLPQKLADNTAKGAYGAMLEDLFQNMYQQRFKIYWMNFIRGVMFAFGSVIGATIMVALLLWLLSLFDQIPIVGHFVDTVRETIRNRPTH